MTFAQPLWLLAAAVAVPLLVVARSPRRVRASSSRLYRSSLGGILLAYAGLAMVASSLALAAIALAQPQVPVDDRSQTTSPGRDIIFALDFSSSMALPYKGERRILPPNPWRQPGSADGATPSHEFRRIDAAQDAILGFVDWRRRANGAGRDLDEQTGGDAIGLIVFDRKPYLRWRLSGDLRQIVRHGSFTPRGKGTEGLGTGTNFGAQYPGPIDMAAEHFQKCGRSTTRVVVMVTDGEDDLKPEVLERLAHVIRDAGMKFYVIGIGDKIAREKLDIEKLCDMVGGKIYRADTQAKLDACFADINQLESSPVPVSYSRSLETVFGGFLTVALVLFLLGVITEAIVNGR